MARVAAPRARPGVYSRVVGLLKVLLPAVALFLLATVFFWDEREDTGVGLTFSEADIEALKTGLKVTRPQFSGVSVAGDLYDFSARTVEPRNLDLTEADIADLDGRISFRDGLVVKVRSDEAVLMIPDQKVMLETGIRISTSDGYLALARVLEIDVGDGTLVAEGPITATGPPGRITADRLQIVQADPTLRPAPDNEVLMHFTGNVTLTYLPSVRGASR